MSAAQEKIGIAIIGAGRMGGRWAGVIAKHDGAKLVSVFDVDAAKTATLAGTYGARAAKSLEEVAKDPAVYAALVLVTHDQLAKASKELLEAGKHILVEKPGARSPSEFEPVVTAARAKNLRLMVGYSCRFHEHIQKAKELVGSGALGDILFVRARYGFGGRPDYDKEWRHDKTVAGGGELIDQGVHLIDLARWFLGDFAHVSGALEQGFWKGEVEDNAFLLLQTARRQTAFLHASWTQWRALFSIEITGTEGYLVAEGLGGKYGKANEELLWGKRKNDFSLPVDTEQNFKSDPASYNPFAHELSEFLASIRENRDPRPSGEDGLKALKIVSQIYDSAR